MDDAVWLVPHTHWDREWYEPFQRFRLRLVDLMDEVIKRAVADPGFHFTLDGQIAVVDDYLEVRPEAAQDIARLVQSGQFAVGPWAILMDEFLCSGENIIRNLQWGLKRATELGGAMPVGYLPDMFGHCAQMPQILASAGLRQACVWRGVPASIDRHAFLWRAPDGTAIRTEYLPGGYGNAAELLNDAGPQSLREHVSRTRPWFGGDAILAMYGTDHSAPIPGLAQAVSALGGEMRMSTLAQYLARFDPGDNAGLEVWQGELRSHARANILPGVLSNRPQLKQGLSAAERLVERYAEPFAALLTPAANWPERLLELAWQRLVQSSCHDSVTGCGVDETAVQVAARIAEAEQIGRGVRDRAIEAIVAATPADAVVVFNPSPVARTEVVEATLPDPGGTGATLFDATRPADWIATGLRRGSLGLDFLSRAVQSAEITGERELTLTMGRAGAGFTPAIRALADQITSGDWRMRVVEEPLRTSLSRVTVPPLGYASLRHAEPDDTVRVTERTLTNGLLTVEVADDGTLNLVAADGAAVSGAGRLADGGDVGDLYNYAPHGDIHDRPDTVTIRRLDHALQVHRSYPWAETTMLVELRAGEPFCRLEIVFTNRRPDHRVRLHVPLARPATQSHAEGQFAVVTRGLTSEGGHGEVPLPTFPAYSFVDSGGVALLLDQVSEYELTGGELALTLLRATGFISRAEHPLRAEPAGPVIATPQAQLIDVEIRTRLAVMPHSGSWSEAGVAAAAERFRCPLLVARGMAAAGGELPSAAGLEVTGDGVMLSSLRRHDADWIELRVVALTDTPTIATIRSFSAEGVVDSVGTHQMRPWEIATVQLRL